MKIERDQRRFQADRARQDPPEPAEVRHARRNDRPQRVAIWSAFRCRSSTCPISATARTAPAASARAMAKKASRSPRAAIDDGDGTGGRQRSRRRPHPGSRSLARRVGRHPGRRARAAPHRAQGQGQHRSTEVAIHQHPPHRSRSRCGTSSAPTWRPCGGRSRRTPYVPDRPLIVPIREDKRYRSWTSVELPEANAVVIYMMDVSGSMTDEQKGDRPHRGVLDRHLARSQYDGIETRYIIHDAAAKEVDEHTFYHTRESGGTRISSAYKVCADLIAREFSAAPEWNIYCFQFSDGDNWGEDNEKSLELLSDAAAAGQLVLLRPGRKPLRQRRIHPLAGARPLARSTDKLEPVRNRKQRSDLRTDQEFSLLRANRDLCKMTDGYEPPP